MMNRRRFFLSEAGLIGAAPWNAKEGDVICVLLGCSSPVILRREDGHYVLIGEAYIDDFMNGDAIMGLENGELVLETFEIH